ncbi:MAG: VOC family protein [Anaerolineae bacterium]|nr:VOC family protein [Anaerolineae bacterium]
MLNRIQVTTVFVRDQDKALDFYTNTLGLKLKVDMPMGENFRWVEVAPENGETSITLSQPFPGMEINRGSTGMIFDTNDIQKLHADLSAKGVNFTQEPTPQPWGGIQAQFSDPDGNLFMVAERSA